MTRIGKGTALLASLIMILAVLALAVVPVMAVVDVYSPFGGHLTIDNEDAPVGTQLKAEIDGVEAEFADSPWVENNVCTLAIAGLWEATIIADAEGKEVTFLVKRPQDTEWLEAVSATGDPALTDYDKQLTFDLVAASGVGPDKFTLTINVYPSGKGDTSPSVGAHIYTAGTSVTIDAIESVDGYEFDRWSGDATGSNPTTTVTMNSNKSITARFVCPECEDGFASWLYANFVGCLVED